MVDGWLVGQEEEAPLEGGVGACKGVSDGHWAAVADSLKKSSACRAPCLFDPDPDLISSDLNFHIKWQTIRDWRASGSLLHHWASRLLHDKKQMPLLKAWQRCGWGGGGGEGEGGALLATRFLLSVDGLLVGWMMQGKPQLV